MSKRFVNLPGAIFLLMALAVVFLAGCATDDPENLAPTPWNSPTEWQNGSLPSGMVPGH